MNGNIIYKLYDKYGIMIEETTSKREFKKWSKKYGEIKYLGINVAKYPTPEYPDFYITFEYKTDISIWELK